MALILAFGAHAPRVGRGVFVAPNATLIGDVTIEDEASIWFGAVLRGDIGSIRIGARTNIQDLACVHLTDGISSTVVGADVTVGHGAILHGCIIGDRCLVGMGSVLLDNCVVGDDSVVAAGSVVTQRMVIPPRSLVRGTPAKIVREVTPEEALMGKSGAQHYLVNARRFLAICGEAGPDERRVRASEERARALDLGDDRRDGDD